MCPVLILANTLEIRLPANTFCPNYEYVMDFPRMWYPRIVGIIGVRAK